VDACALPRAVVRRTPPTRADAGAPKAQRRAGAECRRSTEIVEKAAGSIAAAAEQAAENVREDLAQADDGSRKLGPKE
jgi:hypothetical protein